ncbi:MAG: prolipoprotein diacylglyceryl transferase [Oscillospiraceae bacterium]|nr:prolipoprotein diacylglyceryl transferase [Oscillospiraceae bacterium]
MYPILFEVFGRPIATYGLFMIIGALAAWFLVRLLGGNKDRHMPMAFLICICGGLIGMFLLRPITRIPEIITHWDNFRQLPFEIWFPYLFGDIVFYGGLIGGAAALYIYCKAYKIQMLPLADLFAPGMAIAHGFGRIGCFFGGCCYGIHVDASHPFAVVFPPYSIGAPAGVPLLATQLIEAACLFVIAAVLSFAYKKTAGSGLSLCLYAMMYSVLRFVLEYYRGDEARGIYGPFSTSQYISMAIFCIGIVLIYIIYKRGADKRGILDNQAKKE